MPKIIASETIAIATGLKAVWTVAAATAAAVHPGVRALVSRACVLLAAGTVAAALSSALATAVPAAATSATARPVPQNRPPVAYVLSTNVLCGNASAVTPISTVGNKAGRPIKVGSEPTVIAITTDGKSAYVARQSGVIPISTITNRPGKLIKIGPSGEVPDALALTPKRENPVRHGRCRRNRDPDPDRHQHRAQADHAHP
jgi:hypothetical protein